MMLANALTLGAQLGGGVTLPANVYGDVTVVQNMMNATKRRLIIIGDSRKNNPGPVNIMAGMATWIPWGGVQQGSNGVLNSAGLWSSSRYVQTSNDSPVLSGILAGRYINEYTPKEGYETTFLGGLAPTPLGNSSRFWYFANITRANYPAIFARWGSSGSATANVLTYCITNGGDQVLGRFYESTGATRVDCSPFSAAGSNAFARHTMTQSGKNWTTMTSTQIELAVAAAYQTVNATYHISCEPWIEGSAGLTLFCWPTNGRSIDGFISETTFPTALWTGYVPATGNDPLTVWISLGQNNYAGNSTQQHATKLTTLISRIRSGTPDAEIFLDTQYPNSSDAPGAAYYCAACQSVASSLSKVACIDTHAMCDTYAVSNAAGRMTDTIHMNATGDTYWFGLLGAKMAQCA